MHTLALRKAYKVSCELKDRALNGKTSLAATSQYEVFDNRGPLLTVIDALHNAQQEALDKNMAAVGLVCKIRNRIQSANNQPLPYADGATINDMIAKQATLNELIKFYPEDRDVVVTDAETLRLSAERTRRQLEDTSNTYRSSTNPNLSVSGVSQELKDHISDERLKLRRELETVTGKLAYANITETIELADEEVEILEIFRIPV